MKPCSRARPRPDRYSIRLTVWLILDETRLKTQTLPRRRQTYGWASVHTVISSVITNAVTCVLVLFSHIVVSLFALSPSIAEHFVVSFLGSHIRRNLTLLITESEPIG